MPCALTCQGLNGARGADEGFEEKPLEEPSEQHRDECLHHRAVESCWNQARGVKAQRTCLGWLAYSVLIRGDSLTVAGMR